MKGFLIFLAGVAFASAASLGGEVAIVRQDSNIEPDGTYVFNYELSDGSKAEQSGSVKATGPEEGELTAHGSYSYQSPEGEKVEVSYVADANGYQPQGSHIPVAPPVPELILRAIAYNEAHPEAPGSGSVGVVGPAVYRKH